MVLLRAWTVRGVVVASVALVGAVVAQPAESSAAGAAPNQSQEYGTLYGVVAMPHGVAWAVGGNETTGASVIERFTGGRWHVVPNAVPDATLFDVSADGPHDVLAVGKVESGVPFFQRWNGVTWRREPAAFPHAFESADLDAVIALSPTNAWADGSWLANDVVHPLVEHWDGVRWRVISSPTRSQGAGLASITGVAGNLWAAGHGAGDDGVNRTLIEHWDGTSWSVVPSEDPSPRFDTLNAIQLVDSRHIYAAGWSLGVFQHNLLEHWDGTRFVAGGSRGSGRYDSHGFGLAGTDIQHVYEVGDARLRTREQRTLVMRRAVPWQRMTSANPDPEQDILYDVSAAPGGSVWAVGESSLPGPLIERFNGTSWVSVPSNFP